MDHDPGLVALAVLIALTTSFTALDLASRGGLATGRARLVWTVGSALVMGGGIWGTHFVAMLGFVPGLAIGYDLGLTLLSLVIPILTCGAGLLLVAADPTRTVLVLAGGLLLGGGIVVMHHVGLAATSIHERLSHDGTWIAASIVIGLVAAVAALRLAARPTGILPRVLGGLALTTAVTGMHFTSMAGVTLLPGVDPEMTHGSVRMSEATLALAVSISTFLILLVSLTAAIVDRRIMLLTAREADALRRSELDFRSLYKLTPLPLYSLDTDGRLEHVTESWLKLLGFARHEVIGRKLGDFMTPESVERAKWTDWPVLLRRGEIHDAEYQMVTSDGRVIDVLASARMVDRSAMAEARILGGLTDVTERRRAEAALRQAQKIEAIGHLTGGVAHDFNNLLAAVIGNLELLQRRVGGDARAVRYVENALQGAQRGAALTQRLLSFARRQDLKPRPVDLPELVHGMVDLLHRSIGPTIRIETEFARALPRTLVDANQLELALVNLAVNARDAMPTGGTVTIAAAERPSADAVACGLQAGRYVCLSVADTGEGMDEATLARSTEPFFTTKGVGKGTGLGLSMVQGLAAQSGGHLALSSRPGQGTVAELWLPVANEVAEPGQEAAVAVLPANEDRRAPLTVLVVDDDPLVLANVAAMLEDLGHAVVQASSGEQALLLLRTFGRVELVLTDHAMPGLTGAELIRTLRVERPQLPILLMSGYAERLDGIDPAIPRLGKPFLQANLARAVAAAVRCPEGTSAGLESGAR